MKLSSFIIPILIYTLATVYVAIRGAQALRDFSIMRIIYILCIALLAVLLIASQVWAGQMPQAISRPLTLLGSSYLIIFVYFLVPFLLVDIVRITNYFAHFWQPETMQRIRLYAFGVTVAITGIALGIGNYKFKHPAVVHLEIESTKPSQGKHLKIVALSDMHLGVTIDKKMLQRYVKLINDQQPDIVLIAGDISDRPIEPLIEQKMDEEFRQIKAPLGIYAVSGNHEYYSGNPTATEHFLQKAGVTYLRDSIALVEDSFYVIGRDDQTNTRRALLSDLVKNLPDSLPRIMLDHQPYHLEKAEQSNIDLQISGHTHNGQFFPFNLVVQSIYEKGYGYHERGNTKYYISSGLGIWGPQYRIGTQSEIVVIDWNY